MLNFLQAIRPVDITLLIAFCAAVAAAGTYFVHYIRVRHERARLCVDRASLVGTTASFRLVNAGGRSAFDVLIAVSDRSTVSGMECVRSDEIVSLSFENMEFPVEITLAWTDTLSRRVAECRTIQVTTAGLQFGPVRKGRIGQDAWPLALAT